MISKNVVRHRSTITRECRKTQNNHKSVVVWFTGLSGSGKSTLAHAVEEVLYLQKCKTVVLDEDNIRHGLCGDLGFSYEDRKENLRRIGEVSKLFVEVGVVVLAAFISPFREERRNVRDIIGCDDFVEIYVDCSSEVCESRDVKGLYKKAKS